MSGNTEKNKKNSSALKNMIETFQRGGADKALLISILDLFRSTMLYVPTSVSIGDADIERFTSAKTRDTVTNTEAIRMRPDILKTPDGKLFFPAFTSKEESPEEYRSRMSWLQMEGSGIADMCKKDGGMSGLVINGFSTPMVIPMALVDYIIEQGAAKHAREKGTMMEIVPTGRETDEMKAAAKTFLSLKRREVNYAMLLELHRGGETSYLFVLNSETGESEALFAELNAVVQQTKPKYPVDYVLYPAFREPLEAVGFPVFYRRDGYSVGSNSSRSMEESRLFFVRCFRDADGHAIGWSFDFEKGGDSHYCITSEEAMRLLRRIDADPKADLAETVAKTIGAGTIPAGYLEDSLKELLGKCGIEYSQFHYD